MDAGGPRHRRHHERDGEGAARAPRRRGRASSSTATRGRRRRRSTSTSSFTRSGAPSRAPVVRGPGGGPGRADERPPLLPEVRHRLPRDARTRRSATASATATARGSCSATTTSPRRSGSGSRSTRRRPSRSAASTATGTSSPRSQASARPRASSPRRRRCSGGSPLDVPAGGGGGTDTHLDASARERIVLRTPDEIARIGAACALVHEVLDALARAAVPGRHHRRARPLALAPARARAAPRRRSSATTATPPSLCVSVNDEVVHGIPSPRRGSSRRATSSGSTSASSSTAGTATPRARSPVGHVAPAALAAPRGRARGARARDRRRAARGDDSATSAPRSSATSEGQGFSVVRDFVGHGIGRRLHEPPHVPNFGRPGAGAAAASRGWSSPSSRW